MKYRRKVITVCAAALVLMMTACGSSDEAVQSGRQSSSTESESNSTDGAGQAAENMDVSDGNVLIAYFTAADNSGVDAEASASYSIVDGEAKGRLQAIAEMIQANVGGDLFSIKTDVVYPADGGELIDYAAEEQDEDARPALTSQIENFDSYDVVFVGFPNWWGDMPQVLYSFFDEYDFSGKMIVPFNVHNGSRFSGTIETITELEPDAVVVGDGFTISENDVPDVADDVSEWLEGLDF